MRAASRLAWPILGAVLFALGVTGSGVLFAIAGVILILFSIGASANRSESRALDSAKSGAVRVITIKQGWVNQKVNVYAQHGWTVVNQSSAKSFGSQARVTLTFRKDG